MIFKTSLENWKKTFKLSFIWVIVVVMSFFKLRNCNSNIHHNYKSIKKDSVWNQDREFLRIDPEEQKHQVVLPNMFSEESAKLRAWRAWLTCVLCTHLIAWMFTCLKCLRTLVLLFFRAFVLSGLVYSSAWHSCLLTSSRDWCTCSCLFGCLVFSCACVLYVITCLHFVCLLRLFVRLHSLRVSFVLLSFHFKKLNSKNSYIERFVYIFKLNIFIG